MSNNLALPALNALKIRSTVAIVVTLAAIIAPSIFGGIDPTPPASQLGTPSSRSAAPSGSGSSAAPKTRLLFRE